MIEGKPDPFQYMIKHRKKIIEILDESSTLKNAWNMIIKTLPEIEVITRFNTFKGYVRILKVVDGELSELARENSELILKLGKVRQEKEVFEDELGKVRQKSENFREKLNSISNKENEVLNLECSAARDAQDRGKPNQSAERLGNLPNQDVPKRIDGWGVQLRGQYYRMFKKMNGKVKWIHIGRHWNVEVARSKIRCFTG